jgi:hypothetical protein
MITMRNIDGRLNRLEDRLGLRRDDPRYLLILREAGRELGPAEEAYIQRLDECGSLQTGGFVVVDLRSRTELL